MTDYEDYENNLAFPPTTDRTESTIELVNKIEELNKRLDLKSEYIEKLENKLQTAVDCLKIYADTDLYLFPTYRNGKELAEKVLKQIEELDE